MNKEQIDQLTEAQVQKITGEHLEIGLEECRWCFAVDMERVKGKEIARHDFPDAMVIHYACPRCGEEYTLCSNGFGEDYLKNVVLKLHPELNGQIDRKYLNEVIGRVLSIDDTGKYIDQT